MPPKFWFYQLKALKLTELNRATAIPGLNREDAYHQTINLPPINEQIRISDKLDALLARVDACREHLDRVPLILKSFRQSVLAAACSGRLTSDWRDKHPGFNQIGIPKNNLYDIPNTWDLKRIKKLASSNKGSIQSGPFGSNLLHSEFQSNGILAIGIDNVLDGKFTLGKQHRISTDKYEQLKKYTARSLDVLVTVMSTVGRCCVIPKNIETAIITKHVYRISCEQSIVDPYYMMNCLRGSDYVQQQIQSEIRGFTRPGINGSILKETYIPLPPLPEQKEIVRRVEALFAYADRLEARYHAARDHVEKLTPALLTKAFRGELVPQDPNDEPASVLLERIRKERSIWENKKANKRTRKQEA